MDVGLGTDTTIQDGVSWNIETKKREENKKHGETIMSLLMLMSCDCGNDNDNHKREHNKHMQHVNLPSAEWDACFVGVLVGRRGGMVDGGNGGSSMVVMDGGGLGGGGGLPDGNPC